MPFLFDRIKETTTTTGTGTITLGGAVTNFRTFASVLSNTNTIYYVIEDQTNSAWECGIGTYSSSTLARTTVTASSNAGSLVNFSAGTKYVYCDITNSAASNFAALDTPNTFAAGQIIRIDSPGTISESDCLGLWMESTGTPGTNFGGAVTYYLESSTTSFQTAARTVWSWDTATHASRKAKQSFYVYDTAARLPLQLAANGSAPTIGFLGATPATQQTGDVGTALTTLGLMSGTPTFAAANVSGLGTAAQKNTGTSGNTVPLLDGTNAWSGAQQFIVAPTFTDPANTRSNLGLGSAALKATGTSGSTVPLLDGANTWSAAQTFDAANTFKAVNTFNILDAAAINTVVYPVVVSRSSTGTPGANASVGIKFMAETTTTDNVDVGQIQMCWANPTHASRQASGKIQAYNLGSPSNLIEWGFNSGNPAVGFLNGGPAAQQTGDVVTGLVSYGLWSAGHYLGTGTRNLATEPGGRLTLTSNVPLTVSDVTGAGTIYYTPYNHNGIVLWNGTQWQYLEFTQASVVIGTLTSGKPYDVFGYITAGSLGLEMLAWTSDTARATAVTLQDGRYCKSGDKTRLLLGTFYTTSTSTTEDSVANRYLSNVYNQSPRRLHVCPGYSNNTANTSYTVSTASFQEANGGTGSRCNFVLSTNQPSFCGMSSICITSASAGANIGIGLDSATNIRAMAQSNTVNFLFSASISTGYNGEISGKHAWYCCMYSQAGTASFFADGANSVGGGDADYKDTYLEGWVMG